MKKFLNRLQKNKLSRESSPSTSQESRESSNVVSSSALGGYSVKDKDLPKLHKAVWRGDVKKVQNLVKKEQMIVDKDNRTPLHYACVKGDVDIVRELLEFNAKVNVLDSDCQTPLMKAIEGGHHKCVAMLMDYRADLTVRDNYGNAALHQAVNSGSVKIVSILLKAGVSINTHNQDGMTGLHLAVQKQDKEMVEFLLKNHAEVNCVDSNKRSALMLAAITGNKDLIELLLMYGASTTLKDYEGYTAAKLAKVYKNMSCRKKILNARQKEIAGKKDFSNSIIHDDLSEQSNDFDEQYSEIKDTKEEMVEKKEDEEEDNESKESEDILIKNKPPLPPGVNSMTSYSNNRQEINRGLTCNNNFNITTSEDETGHQILDLTSNSDDENSIQQIFDAELSDNNNLVDQPEILQIKSNQENVNNFNMIESHINEVKECQNLHNQAGLNLIDELHDNSKQGLKKPNSYESLKDEGLILLDKSESNYQNNLDQIFMKTKQNLSTTSFVTNKCLSDKLNSSYESLCIKESRQSSNDETTSNLSSTIPVIIKNMINSINNKQQQQQQHLTNDTYPIVNHIQNENSNYLEKESPKINSNTLENPTIKVSKNIQEIQNIRLKSNKNEVKIHLKNGLEETNSVEIDSWNSNSDSELVDQMAKVESIIGQKIREHARLSFLSHSTGRSVSQNHSDSNDNSNDDDFGNCAIQNNGNEPFKNQHGDNVLKFEHDESDWDSGSENKISIKNHHQSELRQNQITKNVNIKHSNSDWDTDESFSKKQKSTNKELLHYSHTDNPKCSNQNSELPINQLKHAIQWDSDTDDHNDNEDEDDDNNTTIDSIEDIYEIDPKPITTNLIIPDNKKLNESNSKLNKNKSIQNHTNFTKLQTIVDEKDEIQLKKANSCENQKQAIPERLITSPVKDHVIVSLDIIGSESENETSNLSVIMEEEKDDEEIENKKKIESNEYEKIINKQTNQITNEHINKINDKELKQIKFSNTSELNNDHLTVVLPSPPNSHQLQVLNSQELDFTNMKTLSCESIINREFIENVSQKLHDGFNENIDINQLEISNVNQFQAEIKSMKNSLKMNKNHNFQNENKLNETFQKLHQIYQTSQTVAISDIKPINESILENLENKQIVDNSNKLIEENTKLFYHNKQRVDDISTLNYYTKTGSIIKPSGLDTTVLDTESMNLDSIIDNYKLYGEIQDKSNKFYEILNKVRKSHNEYLSTTDGNQHSIYKSDLISNTSSINLSNHLQNDQTYNKLVQNTQINSQNLKKIGLRQFENEECNDTTSISEKFTKQSNSDSISPIGILKIRLIQALKALQNEHTNREELETARDKAEARIREITLEKAEIIAINTIDQTLQDIGNTNDLAENIELNTQLEGLRFKLCTEREQNEYLEQELNKSNENLRQIKTHLMTCEDEKQTLTERMTQLIQRLNTIQNDKQEMEKLNKHLQNELNNSQLKLQKLNNVKTVINAHRDQIKEEHLNWNREYKKIQIKTRNLRNLFDCLKQICQSLIEIDEKLLTNSNPTSTNKDGLKLCKQLKTNSSPDGDFNENQIESNTTKSIEHKNFSQMTETNTELNNFPNVKIEEYNALNESYQNLKKHFEATNLKFVEFLNNQHLICFKLNNLIGMDINSLSKHLNQSTDSANSFNYQIFNLIKILCTNQDNAEQTMKMLENLDICKQITSSFVPLLNVNSLESVTLDQITSLCEKLAQTEQHVSNLEKELGKKQSELNEMIENYQKQMNQLKEEYDKKPITKCAETQFEFTNTQLSASTQTDSTERELFTTMIDHDNPIIKEMLKRLEQAEHKVGILTTVGNVSRLNEKNSTSEQERKECSNPESDQNNINVDDNLNSNRNQQFNRRLSEPNYNYHKLPIQLSTTSFTTDEEEIGILKKRITELESDRDWLTKENERLIMCTDKQTKLTEQITNCLNQTSTINNPISLPIFSPPNRCAHNQFVATPIQYFPQCTTCTSFPNWMNIQNNEFCPENCSTKQLRICEHKPRKTNLMTSLFDPSNSCNKLPTNHNLSTWSIDKDEQNRSIHEQHELQQNNDHDFHETDHYYSNDNVIEDDCINKQILQKKNIANRQKVTDQLYYETYLQFKPELEHSISKHLEAHDQQFNLDKSILQSNNQQQHKVNNSPISNLNNTTTNLILSNAEKYLKNLENRRRFLPKPNLNLDNYVQTLKNKYYL